MDSASTLHAALAGSELFRNLREAFCQATGLSLRLVRAGDPLVRIASPRRQKDFCALTRGNTGACAACLEVQRELQSLLGRKLAPQQVECFAGLTEVAVPVLIGGKHVATLVGGRVFQRKPSRQQFQRMMRKLRLLGVRGNVRAVERAYFKMPVVPARQFQGAVRLLAILANELAESASRLVLLKIPGDPPAVARAKAFVLAHVGEAVTFKAAAEHAHLSRHHFCRIFKQSTGITFTEFVACVRVEKVKELLHNPALRITEAATRAGFQSISQFNRVFRRCTGTSPTCFRAQVRNGSGGQGLAQ
ncbi:MAG TPA: PocR ligand-binding domain-containing protein [Candidatus Limnocylindrales bacterium]|nr:PocR ligand-binding domain-containing protein [Candidatus Limnocylindrales bacterium]